jgi:hypothetical protein
MGWRAAQMSNIGVDLSGRWLKAAQWRLGSGRPVLAAWGRMVRPEGWTNGGVTPEEAAGVAEWLERRGFARAPLTLSVPRDGLAAGALELPPASSGAPLEQIARLELARVSRSDAGRLVASMWPVPRPVRGGEATHALGVGVPEPRALALIEPFEGVGLAVSVLDVREWALVRGVGEAGAGPGVRCLIETGWDATMIVLLVDGVVVFARALELAGLSRLYAVLRDRFGLSAGAFDGLLADPTREGAAGAWQAARGTLTEYLDALSPEVGRSLTYAEHRYPDRRLEAVVLAGEGAVLPGLAERLGSELKVECRLARPGSVTAIAGPSGRVADDPGLIVAMGLAMPARGVIQGRAAA